MRLEDAPGNYDRAAAHNDRPTDLVFGRLLRVERHRERAIDLLGDLSGARVLDIGCGTERRFPLLASRVGDDGTVVGLDYSPGMLDRARRRVDDPGWDRVGLVRGEAATPGGVRGPFDAVLAVRCLGIVHDLESAVNAAVDRLRPDGRIAIMDFQRTRADSGLLRRTFPVYRRLLQRAGIDSAEDLDDARFRSRWRRGREILGHRLEDITEERYLRETGMIVAGTKPGRGFPSGEVGSRGGGPLGGQRGNDVNEATGTSMESTQHRASPPQLARRSGYRR